MTIYRLCSFRQTHQELIRRFGGLIVRQAHHDSTIELGTFLGDMVRQAHHDSLFGFAPFGQAHHRSFFGFLVGWP
jgi:hypothetical protein